MTGSLAALWIVVGRTYDDHPAPSNSRIGSAPAGRSSRLSWKVCSMASYTGCSASDHIMLNACLSE